MKEIALHSAGGGRDRGASRERDCRRGLIGEERHSFLVAEVQQFGQETGCIANPCFPSSLLEIRASASLS